MKKEEIKTIAHHLRTASEIAINTARNTEDDGLCIHVSITLDIDGCRQATYQKIAKEAGLICVGKSFLMGIGLQGNPELEGTKEAFFYLVGCLPLYRWIFEYAPD